MYVYMAYFTSQLLGAMFNINCTATLSIFQAPRLLSRCYLRPYLVRKYCLQRAQHEVQEQSSNTEEQATSSSELNTSIIIIRHLIFEQLDYRICSTT